MYKMRQPTRRNGDRYAQLWLGAQTFPEKVHGVIPQHFLGIFVDLGEQRLAALRSIRPFAPGRFGGFAPLDAKRREENRRAHLRQTLTCLVPRTQVLCRWTTAWHTRVPQHRQATCLAEGLRCWRMFAHGVRELPPFRQARFHPLWRTTEHVARLTSSSRRQKRAKFSSPTMSVRALSRASPASSSFSPLAA